MKTIEERAEEYIEPFRANLLSCETDLMKQAYIAGAKEALAGQWRSVDDKLPEIDDVVVVTYPNLYVPSDRDMGTAYYDGEDWYTTDDTHIRPTHWMPIPEPPKIDKK